MTPCEPPVSAPLSITRAEAPEGLVLAVSGELDAGSVPELEAELERVKAEGHPRVVLDLRQLTFVDSAGVTALLRAKKAADEAGRVLVLRGPTAQVERVLSLVGLRDWITFD